MTRMCDAGRKRWEEAGTQMLPRVATQTTTFEIDAALLGAPQATERPVGHAPTASSRNGWRFLWNDGAVVTTRRIAESSLVVFQCSSATKIAKAVTRHCGPNSVGRAWRVPQTRRPHLVAQVTWRPGRMLPAAKRSVRGNSTVAHAASLPLAKARGRQAPPGTLAGLPPWWMSLAWWTARWETTMTTTRMPA